MVKPALSMKPTGWFQVAWSAEITAGEVRRMKYFGEDLIAWRTSEGDAVVMAAYCEHLGANLGYGGRVEGDRIICPFHGWEWNREGKNVCIPYQDKPNRARKIKSWTVAERNESVYVWHDLNGGGPTFEVPDIFEAYEDGRKAEDYYLGYPEGIIHRERLELHPQYVMENGVDYAHFKFVHRAMHVPRFTRQEFDGPVSRADFEMLFGGNKESTVLTPNGAMEGGVQAINIGLGVGMAKFWGPDNMRTTVCVTPVDEETADIRSTVWLDRLPGDTSPHQPEKLERRQRMANNQFLADLNIWEHQKYADPPALATAEGKGFRAIRKWAMQFYPVGELGSASTPELQTAGTDADDTVPDNEAESTKSVTV